MNSTSTAAAHNSLPGERKRSWRAWWRLVRIPLVILTLFICLVLGVVYFQATYVSGREFNTDTWEIRQFAFRRDPFTNWQLGGVRHTAPSYNFAWTTSATGKSSDIDPSIKQYLPSKRSPDRPPAKWDLIDLRGTGGSTGAATILIELVDTHRSDYDAYWPHWNRDNPKKAKHLWPAVHDLVAFGLYAALPPVFELTQVAATPDEFERQLQQQVVEILLEYAQQQADQGNQAAARQAALVGQRYGESPEWDQWLQK